MAAQAWNNDAPADFVRIGKNTEALLRELLANAPSRARPTIDLVRSWHRQLYDGCSIPAPEYIGNFRGDTVHPALLDYEVGVGPIQPDGYHDRSGVWAADVEAATRLFERRLAYAVDSMDALIRPGERPVTADVVRELVQLIAVVHGEWVRIHPFANGNGRTALAWTAFLALRYGLPAFVNVKPRPTQTACSRSAQASMGRPPDFVGDHREAVAVFARLLTLSLPD